MSAAVSDDLDLRPIREAAALAGVTTATVRRWIHEKRFRGYRLPGGWRVEWHEFTEWVLTYDAEGDDVE